MQSKLITMDTRAKWSGENKTKQKNEELQHLHREEQCASEGDTVSNVNEGLLLIKGCCVFCYQLKRLNWFGCSYHLFAPRPPHLTC